MRHTLALLIMLLAMEVAADSIRAEAAWTRAMPPGSSTAAVYLRIHNAGAEAAELLSVQTPVADKGEVHEHRHRDGMMQMRRVESFKVPAGASVELAPGGYHLMLFALKRTPRAGETFVLKLEFDRGDAVEVMVTVRGLGEES